MPAQRRVFPFSVFTHDVEINIARLLAGQRAGHAGEEANRAQVHILIEFPTEFQQRPPQGNMVRNRLRPADGAKVNGVKGG